MRLFEKYLLACTNQRIPMPPQWQSSLGLDLAENVQKHIDTDVNSTTGKEEPISSLSEIVGYRFQQDDIIERGYVHRQVRSMDLDVEARYLISLYLQAIKNHRGTDFTPYFQIGVTEYTATGYLTTAPVIRGETYSVYGDSIMPVTFTLYSEASKREFITLSVSSFSRVAPQTFDVQQVLNDYVASLTDSSGAPLSDEAQAEELLKLQAEDEYLMLKVISNSEVFIVPGTYPVFTVRQSQGEFVPSAYLYPSVVYVGTDYSDKLIPTLLDIEITKNSPLEAQSLLSSLDGTSLADKIKRATKGIYDIDEFIGNKTLLGGNM